MAGPSIRETDLYQPIHDYLTANGYEVHAEVKSCDLAAKKGDELVVVELKRSFNATLLIQATERQRAADSVYVAIAAPKGPQRGPRWRGMLRLLRRLELGLIIVHFRPGGARVEVLIHPGPYVPRARKRLRRDIIREIDGRSGNHNVGGSPAGTKIVTAYRECAIFIACCLDLQGPMRPAELRKLGTGAKTQAVLYNNHYGWFDRLGNGQYSLHEQGRAALEDYPAIALHYRKLLAHENGTK